MHRQNLARVPFHSFSSVYADGIRVDNKWQVLLSRLLYKNIDFYGAKKEQKVITKKFKLQAIIYSKVPQLLRSISIPYLQKHYLAYLYAIAWICLCICSGYVFLNLGAP